MIVLPIRLTSAVVILAAALTISGCSSSVGNSPDVGPTNPSSGNLNPAGAGPAPAPAATAALFQPAQGIFPFPNDLYFSGTTDGTINIQPANALIVNQVGLNAQDGWSTTAPIRVRFASAIDPTSLTATNVRVVPVTTSNTNKAVNGVAAPLVLGTHYSIGIATDTGVGNTILEIRPLRPFTASSGQTASSNGILVLLTNTIRMADGSLATADRDYATIKSTLFPAGAAAPQAAACATLPNAPMQGACGFTASHLTVAPAVGVPPANVILSFHFSTQSTRDVMNVVAGTIFAGARPVTALNAPPGIPLNLINPALPATALARSGILTVPYYSYIPTPLAPGGLSTDRTGLSTAWRALNAVGGENNLTRFNPLPELRASKQIPLLVITPATAKPVGGWPVVIFQHGITRDRTDAFALAQALTAQGWAIVAIDLPLHGITSTTNGLYQATNEQTFNLDLVVNASGATGPDGVIDSTGTHFINLTYPLASRDNLRQGATNLLALLHALPALNTDGDPATDDIDEARVGFIGHSLGGIVGTVFSASVPATLPVGSATLRTTALIAPGGGVAELLRDSPSFGPRINAGLQGQGLLPGTSLYAQYFRDTQTLVDAGDPLNYAAAAIAARPIYLAQMVGGGGTTPALPDQVIPNAATARLIAAITSGGASFPRVPAGGVSPGSGYVNFIQGDHGTLLSPAASPAATVEMQTEVATFTIAPAVIQAVNAAVVQP
jgi:alpha-beta hydrolase superfamily lysophospholipase